MFFYLKNTRKLFYFLFFYIPKNKFLKIENKTVTKHNLNFWSSVNFLFFKLGIFYFYLNEK